MRHAGRQVVSDPRELPVCGAELNLLPVLVYSLYRSDDFIALIPVSTNFSVPVNVSARVVPGQGIAATNERYALAAGCCHC
jgi:hypothetical protein